MALIETQPKRLDVWRQRELLRGSRAKFGLALAGHGVATPVGIFGVAFVLLLLADAMVASWFDISVFVGVPLCFFTALGVTGATTGALWLRQQRTIRRVGVSLGRSMAIQQALGMELEVAGTRRVELDVIEIVAQKAWICAPDTALSVLVLDCGTAGVLCLRGQLVGELCHGGSTKASVRVERLRWTHAVLIARNSGAELGLSTLVPDALDFDSSGQCEVFTSQSVPACLAAAIGYRHGGYR